MNCINEALKIMPRLSVPDYIKYYSQEYVEDNNNGCGDKWTAWIVPETILGMSIKLACIVHDLEYQYIISYVNSHIRLAWTEKELLAMTRSLKLKADLRFKQNIQVLADYEFLEERNGTFSFLFWLSENKQAKRKKNIRYAVAEHIYFEAVDHFGWNALKDKLKFNK